MRPLTAPVINVADTYSWLSPVKPKPLSVVRSRSRSRYLLNSLAISPVQSKNVTFTDQSDDCSSIGIFDSFLITSPDIRRTDSRPNSIRRLESFPTTLPPTALAKCTSASVRQRVDFASEVKEFRESCEGNYKKYRSPKRPDEFGLFYDQWQKYFKTHKSNITVKIGKGELEKFWFWFESRMDEHTDEGGGIKIDRVIEDFVDYGVVSTAAEAAELLKQIDEDASGTISIEEFMAGVNSGEIHQIGRLKYFMSKIGKMSKKEREEWDKSNRKKKSRRKDVMTKLRSVRMLKEEVHHESPETQQTRATTTNEVRPGDGHGCIIAEADSSPTESLDN